MPLPELESLRLSPRPAWLWDARLRRVTWANEAAVAWFGESSLLDLVERPFDEREPAVAALAAALADLSGGEERHMELDFPSVAHAPLAVSVRRHALGDGRPGLLVVGDEPLEPERRGYNGLMREVLDAMPMPVAAVDARGELIYSNHAASELFSEQALMGLSGLFDSAGEALEFLSRAARAGLAVTTRKGETLAGKRDIRITARLIDGDGGGLFSVVLDDVTNRRAVERHLQPLAAQGHPAIPATRQGPREPQEPREPANPQGRPLLSEEDARTFHRLSTAPAERPTEPAEDEGAEKPQTEKPQTEKPEEAGEQAGENEEVREAGKEPAAPTAPAKRRPREPQQVPQLVRDVLDHRPEPIILHRNDAFLYANDAAREAFAFAADDAAWGALVRQLTEARDGGEITLADATGKSRAFRLARDVFPWRDGAVIQSTLTPLAGPDKSGEAEDVSARAAPGIDETGIDENSQPAPEGPSPATEAAKPRQEADKPRDMARRTPLVRISASPRPPARQDRQEQHEPQEPREEGSAPLAGKAPCAPAPDGAPEALGEELRAILDTATDGIITLDQDGEILSFSAGAEALFGASLKEVINTPFRALLDEKSRRILDDYLDVVKNGGEMATIYNEGREVTARVAGNGTIPLFLTIGRLGRRGEPERPGKAAFCVVVRDMTQWKKTESELRAAKERAERSSAQKSEFLASISHELRTPLNAILGFSDVMRQQRFGEMGNEKYLAYANDIHESGEHLLSLINDLLDLSKIEAGKFELDFKAVDLKEIATDCLHLVEEMAARGQVLLRKSIPDDLPKVVADARAVKQILLNLLSNAVKFTPAGGQVVLSMKLTGAGELVVSVSDTGPGMTEEEMEKALKPFERLSGEGREDKPGTGLGLPLTKALAEANKARFELDSKPGHGVTARVIFPTPRVLAG